MIKTHTVYPSVSRKAIHFYRQDDRICQSLTPLSVTAGKSMPHEAQIMVILSRNLWYLFLTNHSKMRKITKHVNQKDHPDFPYITRQFCDKEDAGHRKRVRSFGFEQHHTNKQHKNALLFTAEHFFLQKNQFFLFGYISYR
jgi:hypothetical protein